CFSGAGSSACPPGAIVAANRVAVSSWCLIDLSCKSERRQEAGTESRAVCFSIPAFCAAESSVVARRATDEFVHRLRAVQHLRRGLPAAHGPRAIEEAELTESYRAGRSVSWRGLRAVTRFLRAFGTGPARRGDRLGRLSGRPTDPSDPES